MDRDDDSDGESDDVPQPRGRPEMDSSPDEETDMVGVTDEVSQEAPDETTTDTYAGETADEFETTEPESDGGKDDRDRPNENAVASNAGTETSQPPDIESESEPRSEGESLADSGEDPEQPGDGTAPEVVFDEISLDSLSTDILLALFNAGGEATTSDLREMVSGVDVNQKIIYRVQEHLAPQGVVETHQPEPEGNVIPPKQITITSTGEEYVEHHQRENDPDELSTVQTQIQSLRTRMQELESKNEQLEAENDRLRDRLESISPTDSITDGEAGRSAGENAQSEAVSTREELAASVSTDRLDDIESRIDATQTTLDKDYNELQQRIDELRSRVETVETDSESVSSTADMGTPTLESHPLIAGDAGIDLLNRTFAVGNTVQRLLVNNTSVTQKEVQEAYSDVFNTLQQQGELLEPTERIET